MKPSMVLALVLALTACGKDKEKEGAGGTTCGPLKVTIDGKEVTGLAHGLALTTKQRGNVSEQVQVFNHDKTTCEEVLSKSGRMVPEGEVSVRAFAGKDVFAQGVSMESYTNIQGGVWLLGKTPEKPGDVVELCVGEQTFEPTIGKNEGKKVTISGRFTGTYCGTMER